MILPTRPDSPGAEALKDPQKAADYQQEMANYNFALQCMKAVQDEENMTRSNIQKSGDEALKNTISNMK